MFGGPVLGTADPLDLGFGQDESFCEGLPQPLGKVGHLGDGLGLPTIDPFGQLVSSVSRLLPLPQEVAYHRLQSDWAQR